MGYRDHARTILSAWQRGDEARVGTLLDQPLGSWAQRATSADEEERQELLMGIKARLRTAPGDAPVTAVSLRLLRHLAAAN